MMTKCRKFLSVLLVLCMTISMLTGYSMSASAEDEENNVTTIYWVSEKNASYSNPEGTGDIISLSSLPDGTYRIDAESFEKGGILSSLCIGAATGTDYVKVYIPDGAGIAEIRNGDENGSAKGASEFIIDAEGGTVYESSDHFSRGTALFRYNISDDVLNADGVEYNTKFVVQNMHLVLTADVRSDAQKDTVIFDVEKTKSFELYNVTVTGCKNMAEDGNVVQAPYETRFDNVCFDAATQACIAYSKRNKSNKIYIYSCDFSSCTKNAIARPKGSNVGNFDVIFVPTGEVNINGKIQGRVILGIDEKKPVAIIVDDKAVSIPAYGGELFDSRGNEKNFRITLLTSYAASVSGDREGYAVGETVNVTAAFTPTDADILASGELKFSYDKDKLDFLSVSSNESLLGNDARATCDENNAVCTASFKTASGSEINAEKGKQIILATFSFIAKKAGTAAFTVTKAAASAREDVRGRVAIKPASAASIDILQSRISTSKFAADYVMLKYTAAAKPSEGNAYFVGDTALTYVPAYAERNDEYVFVALYQEKNVPTSPEAEEKTGTYTIIDSATGDANHDGATNIADTQTVMYMTRSTFNSKTTGLDWLNSDVNGDGVVNSLDAKAIQYYAHYKKFGEFSN